MNERLTPDDVAGIDDVDRLWAELGAAKRADRSEVVRAIEQRMRELRGDRRFAHLSDDELDRRIEAISRHREAEDMIGHSPGGSGMEGDSRHTSALNDAIRANQRVGIEETLGALLDERRRRTTGR